MFGMGYQLRLVPPFGYITEKVRRESYFDYLRWSVQPVPSGRPPGHPCRKGTFSSTARIAPEVGSRRPARTGCQRKMSGRLFGYACVSVASDADANSLESERWVLAGCEQVFEDVGSWACLDWPGLNRLKQAVAPGDFVKVAELDRMGRSAEEVLGWLRENKVEIISLRESIDQDSAALYRSLRPHCAGPGGAVQSRGPGVGGVEFLTGGAPTADIIGYPDGTMAFNPTVGWGKDGLSHSIRSALDRGRALRAAGWGTTPLLINDN